MKGSGDDSIPGKLQRLPFFFFLLFPAVIETSLQLNEQKKEPSQSIYRKAAVFAEGTITMASGGGSSLLSTVETSGVG